MIELMPDATIFYQWLVFIAALIVLNYGIFRPVLRIIAARREATEGAHKKADEFEKRIEEIKLKIDESLNQAQAEGQQVIAKLRQEAEQTANEMIEKARSDMDRELKTVRENLEEQSREVEDQLEKQASDLSNILAQRVIGRTLN